MQIVIDIDDNLYTRLFNNGDIDAVDMLKACVTIRKGTPLPKGHGTLKDTDALCDYFWDNRSKLYTHKDLQIVIDNAPTIIEADRESEG